MPNTTIASNAVGIYLLPTPQNRPIQTVLGNTVATTLAPYGSNPNDYVIVKTGLGVFVGIGQVVAPETNLYDATSQISLVGAATSTSIETASSISEVAARTGIGISEMFISSGASSWSSSIDGLVYVDDATYEGTPTTAIDAANAKYFVILKFEIGPNEGYIGQGLIENASITAAVDDIATYSVSVKGYGDLIKL
jgi:predicted secreted protein